MIEKHVKGKKMNEHNNNVDIFKKCKKLTRYESLMRENTYPYFRKVESAQDAEVIIEGKKVLMMCSNDYLGLSNDIRLKKAVIDAVNKYGCACTGSRYANGNLDIHEKLEEELAEFIGKESGQIFNSGFMTNLGVIESIVGPCDVAVTDKYDHTSIEVGCRVSSGRRVRFAHNDMDNLEHVLRNLQGADGILVIVDGVFSLEGDITNLPEVVRLAKKYKARVMLDDAHAFGVIGKTGRGTIEHYGMDPKDVDIYMNTFSKSLASLGGYVAADKDIILYIKHFAKSQIFTVGLSPADVAAATKALEIIKENPERRKILWSNAKKMREGLKDIGFDLGSSCTQIASVMIRDEKAILKMWQIFKEEGIHVMIALFPGVPRGGELIRLTCTANHTDAHINKVIEVFKKAGKIAGLI
ncbi:aminotransferase class I/II-fold pyridoxal phosphate-dependent enzyme [Elusimicrobiota bacterium]